MNFQAQDLKKYKDLYIISWLYKLVLSPFVYEESLTIRTRPTETPPETKVGDFCRPNVERPLDFVASVYQT